MSALDRPAAGSTTAPLTAAPPSRVAEAARAHGDEYPPLHGQGSLRLAGAALVVAFGAYLAWLLAVVDLDAPWVAGPFVAANVFSFAYVVLGVANAWHRRVPERRPLPVGDEPVVAVIIPTGGEPVPMVLRTVQSVLDQDWPAGARLVVVSDDGHDPRLRAALEGWPVAWWCPPELDAPGRDGAAKAGNLNAALAMLAAEHPEVVYVETRDADDEVGSRQFLRHVVGQLEADDGLAFVQTIKEAQVDAGDPFNNRDPMVYRSQMLARNAANAAFPCGSGLVWRRRALDDIGGFPTWNLVEDLQSGVEALRRGWRGLYLPIVGAVGQHAPQDVPNVYKQRGTWALDTVRLLVWGERRGLGWRQRAHFAEVLLFYVNAFTVLVYVPVLAATLWGRAPVRPDGWSGLASVAALALATELWLLAVDRPYADRRRRARRPWRSLWQARVMWTGLAPVYMLATARAVLGGRRRKPVYRVTRKHTRVGWYWRETAPQAAVVALLVCSAVASGLAGTWPGIATVAAPLWWGGLQVALLAAFVRRGWHGVRPSARRAAPPGASGRGRWRPRDAPRPGSGGSR